ncbi:MAG: cysteine--tRNA ligase [Candidatus Nitrosopelagicus sp.]|nr:cysteine--tRNA ligase [Candidatus Nitrosopelagicus sp.]
MKIFDTLSNSEKYLEFQNKVRIYLCGVTVYDDSHIGHARTIVVFDVLRRFIESKGIKVDFIQNFTDVDDKIIKKAIESESSPEIVSEKYIKNYFDDFDRLNIKRATEHPKATEHIPDMLNLISVLIEKNMAYVSKNGVYFRVSKFSDYGKLSKKKVEELESGARIEIDGSKENPLDFALWKFSDSDTSWQSPWGNGRPGWHIECSAMSVKYLGESFEIHGGGRDLIFPHHENEIAQSESFTEKPFAKIWMHAGMITINGEKMSKSIGNVKTVSHVLENWGPNIIRLFCLSGHYSKPIDYTEDLLRENLIKWRQLETCYYELRLVDNTNESENVEATISNSKQKFDNALENDFNTSMALTEFFNMVKFINGLAADEKITKNISEFTMPVLEYMLDVLGLNTIKATDDEIKDVFELIQKREEYRKNKQFEDADAVRDRISNMGIHLIDHRDKTLWMKREQIKADI